LAALII